MADFYLNSDLLCDTYHEKGARGISYFPGSLSVEPVTVQDFKDHAKIDFATDDNLIATYLTAARETVERILRKSLGVRTVTFYAEYVPKRFKLDWGNYASIDTPATGFTLFGKDILKEGGTDITLTLTTDDTVMNSDIKNAILKQAFNFYENRAVYSEGGTDEVMNILQPYRNIQFP
jgi:hypothetical protein